jgi:hypothetical protein
MLSKTNRCICWWTQNIYTQMHGATIKNMQHTRLRTAMFLYIQTYWLQCSREPVTDRLFLLPLRRSEHLNALLRSFALLLSSSSPRHSQVLPQSPLNLHSKTVVSMIILSIHALLHPCSALSNLTLRNPSVFRLSVRPSAHLQPSLQLHEHRAPVLSPRCNLSHRSNLFFCHIKIT